MYRFMIFLMIGVASAISAGILYFFTKEKNWVRPIIFFYTFFYFTFTTVKFRLDGPDLNLYESFWDALPSTCVTYGAILLIMSIMIPIVYSKIMCSSSLRYLEYHVSIDIVLLVVVRFFFGKVSHISYIILFVIVSFVAFGMLILKNDRMKFWTSKEVFHLFKSFWLVLVFPVFLILFYYPNELFLTNASEFMNQYHEFVIILLVALIVAVFAEVLLIGIIPRDWFKPCILVIFSYSICSYLQATFFNGSMKVMMGQHQQWEPLKFIVNIVIWIALIIGFTVVGLKKNKIEYVIKYLSAFVILFLTITLISLGIQNVNNLAGTYGELTTKDDLVLSEGKNVIVFVLDLYDSRVFDEIAALDPKFVEPLKDFTYYNGASTRHPYTAFSIPYLLTGTQWKEDESKDFYKYAYDGETFISDLYNNGVNLGIYTAQYYVADVAYPMISNYRRDVVRESDILNTVSVMSKASFYKTMPFISKEKYFYYTGDVSSMVKQGNVWSIDNDIPFYNRIVSEGITVSDEFDSAYRFYHMRGAHYPFYLSDNIQEDRTLTQATMNTQAKGSMRIVYEYLEQLKRIDMYDNTTIIITSDHGSMVVCDNVTKKINDVSSPILFVKRAKEHGDGLKYNNAQVCHTEMLSTILDCYGMNYSKYGERLEDVDEDDARERYFGYYSNDEGVVKGKVVGDCRNLDNWIVD